MFGVRGWAWGGRLWPGARSVVLLRPVLLWGCAVAMVLLSEFEAQNLVGRAAMRLVTALRDRPEATVLALLDGRRCRARLSPRQARCLRDFRHARADARDAGLGWVVDEQVAGAREMVLAGTRELVLASV